jgi:hypothetical protein
LIRNDTDLAVEQEALAGLERALESLRQRVEPKNPRNYAIFSEAYIDEINKLKSQISEYLAKKGSTAHTPANPGALEQPPAKVS